MEQNSGTAQQVVASKASKESKQLSLPVFGRSLPAPQDVVKSAVFNKNLNSQVRPREKKWQKKEHQNKRSRMKLKSYKRDKRANSADNAILRGVKVVNNKTVLPGKLVRASNSNSNRNGTPPVNKEVSGDSKEYKFLKELINNIIINKIMYEHEDEDIDTFIDMTSQNITNYICKNLYDRSKTKKDVDLEGITTFLKLLPQHYTTKINSIKEEIIKNIPDDKFNLIKKTGEKEIKK